MIKLTKPVPGPEILTGSSNRGPKNDYDNNNKRDFEFDSDIYGAKSVKNKLIEAQHHKCCFCEAKITHTSYGDVEHFRPKGGWIQKEGDTLTKPGYYWLAYDWSNLFLSCQKCNQRHKKNKFPLSTPASRATSHHASIVNEGPLFVHPTDDDPEQFIGFRDEVPYAINGNARGKSTIEELGLKRQELTDHRADYLATARQFLDVFFVLQKINASNTLALSPSQKVKLQEVQAHLQSLKGAANSTAR